LRKIGKRSADSADGRLAASDGGGTICVIEYYRARL
jgi:hypothetical protein